MEALEQLLPQALLERCEPLAILHDSLVRQSLLLRLRDGGGQLVLKRSAEIDNLRQEAGFLEELAGEGIPALVGFEEDGQYGYLLREYIPGETLLDYVQKRERLSAEETVGLGLALCAILKRLHQRTVPVIHRDIKAENVIRRPDGSLCLIDFGTARRYETGARKDTNYLGTPGVAPPEQFGYRQTDPRSDVYAVGCLLHTLATGETELSRGRAAPGLERVVRTCVRFDPEKRYASAAALERALLRLTPLRRRLRLGLTAALVLLPLALAGALLLRTWTSVEPDSLAASAGTLRLPAVTPILPPDGTAWFAESSAQNTEPPLPVKPTDPPPDSSGRPAETTGETAETVSEAAETASEAAETEAGGFETSGSPAETPTTPAASSTGPAETQAQPSAQPTEPTPNDPAPAVIDGLYHFASPEIEREVCRQLGREPGPVPEQELEKIETLMLCGDWHFMNAQGFFTLGKNIMLPDLGVIDSGVSGTIHTVEDIPNLPKLRRLMLCRQELSDISPLAGCGLEWLALAGNRIESIAPLADCSALQELWLSDNPVIDLTPLKNLPALRDLYLDGTPVSDLTPLARMQLNLVDLFDCSQLSDLTPLLEMRSLRCLKCFPLNTACAEVIGQMNWLTELHLWLPDDMTDLKPISTLNKLLYLFVELRRADSCEGLQNLTKLRTLAINNSGGPVNLQPVAALRELEILDISGLSTRSCSPLQGLYGLRSIVCSPSQATELRTIFADTQVEIRLAA